MRVEVRKLRSGDAADFQALRLHGLVEAPTAFGSSFEEEKDATAAEIAARIEPNQGGFVLGAFDGGKLVGVVGMRRERHRKEAHKIYLWGMYVAPKGRGRGIGRALVESALREGFALDGVRQVKLGVNAANTAAKQLYEACGFVPYGLERACLVVDGVPQDEIHMVCFRPGA